MNDNEKKHLKQGSQTRSLRESSITAMWPREHEGKGRFLRNIGH
jgi:hypothetical protein